jgi:hypothetical protein
MYKSREELRWEWCERKKRRRIEVIAKEAKTEEKKRNEKKQKIGR